MTWVLGNLGVIASAGLAHVSMALPAIVLSCIVSVPVGWFAYRFAWARGTTLTVVGLLYAIPSLPLFILLPSVLGTSIRSTVNVVVALTAYGVALMTRSVADGLAGVGPGVLQSARAMGYSSWGRIWQVQLPLAGPSLLAGLRVAAVSTISLVTVSAVLGVDSFGMLFIDGFQRGIIGEILAGVLATALLALVIDLALVAIGKVLFPWTKREKKNSIKTSPAGSIAS